MKQPLVFAILIVAMSILLSQCQNAETPSAASEPSGEELAKAMCSSCHRFPEPSLLDKASWEKFVLPRMGYFLGHYDQENTREKLIEDGPAEAVVEARNIFPEKPLIDSISWDKIKHYFLSNAPEKLRADRGYDIAPNTAQFKAVRPSFALQPPSVTAVYSNNSILMLGDAFTGSVHVLNHKLQSLGAIKTGESPVWISEDETGFYVTVMGSFSPTDAPNGKLIYLFKDPKRKPVTLIENLQRPVHHEVADFDGDGLLDFVVCEFAKWTGSLSWYKNLGKNQFEKHVIKAQPGAMKAYPRDWNNDGKMDIIALFGQGNEGISVFLNQDDGSFKEEYIKRLPPSMGSSFMQLKDANGDGTEDIVYCAGDNADFGPILKPYHGIYVWYNNGKNAFNDSLYVRLNGAYGAEFEDFDQDGDMDIAAISFFPNYDSAPEESFVYFENLGNKQYRTASIPQHSAGRWIVMNALDIDNDSDKDLILASLAFEAPGHDSLVQQWIQQGIPFVVLENLKN